MSAGHVVGHPTAMPLRTTTVPSAIARIPRVRPGSNLSPMEYACATCTKTSCFRGELDRMPKTCPTLTQAAVAKDITPYLEKDRADVMRVADQSPFDPDGGKRNRVQELLSFVQGRGMRRIGIAFCVTLIAEAQELARQLRATGLETELVCCRVGAIDYAEIGLPKAHPEHFAAICNPVAQARLLNQARVDLVAQVGLCMGHDLILQEECDAPVTTVVVKDRVHDHHPVVALRKAPDVPMRAADVLRSADATMFMRTTDWLQAAIDAGRPPVIIDLRSESAYEQGHIPGSMNTSLAALPDRIDGNIPRDREVICVCNGSVQSAMAVIFLRTIGYQNALNLSGGYSAWERQGRPVERPDQSPHMPEHEQIEVT
jgi:uncharacterized metal-binding protein/rhodanese-related sulfurtransferase